MVGKAEQQVGRYAFKADGRDGWTEVLRDGEWFHEGT